MSNMQRTIIASIAVGLALLFAPGVTLAGEHAAKAPDGRQIARGAKAWVENCGRCHNLRNPKELQDYEWDVTVTHMRVRAGLPGQVARDIKAFLKASNR